MTCHHHIRIVDPAMRNRSVAKQHLGVSRGRSTTTNIPSDIPVCLPNAVSSGINRAGNDGILGYMPQLDGLRAIAVLAVLFYHFFPSEELPQELRIVPWGSWGVQLFFILSGFLITGVLLNARLKADNAGGCRLFFLRRFYIRRSLRILPLYYLVIVMSFILDLGATRTIMEPLLTYTLNFHMAERGSWDIHFAHYWTLNVEEHFYIVWPWLVLFAPRPILPILAAGAVVSSPFYRMQAHSDYWAGIHTLGSLEFIGLGALLTLAKEWIGSREQLGRFLRFYVMPTSLTLIAVSQLETLVLPREVTRVALAFGWGLLFSCIVGWASHGITGPIGTLLQSHPLLYVGKISYGIYVYHAFMHGLFQFAVETTGSMYQPMGLEKFLVLSSMSMIVASVSWYALEQPVNKVKRLLPAQPTRAVRGSASPVELKPKPIGRVGQPGMKSESIEGEAALPV
jgi:peptidoglycan/LPS O-acetylase OafA/YrhL